MAECSMQELDLLLDRLCEESLEEDSNAVNRLVELVDESEACRHRYLDTIELHAALWRMGGDEPSQSLDSDAEIAIDSHVSEQMILSESHFSLSNILSTTCHGTIGFFSQELPFSLLVATVLTCFGLWAASLVYVSNPTRVSRDSLSSSETAPASALKIVGKITGMIDCRWLKGESAPSRYDNVFLGRKFALDSGLMEITYNTGAKVILQGPVTYEVESKNGGFLRIGKLTGKVENKAAKGFVVRTPSATVTDLGTEFGVEVDSDGVAEVYVFQGKVEGHLLSRSNAVGQGILLHKNEAASFVPGGDGICRIPISPQRFVRAIHVAAKRSVAGLIAYEGFEEAKGHSGTDQSLLAGMHGGIGWLDAWYSPDFHFRGNEGSFARYPANLAIKVDRGEFENCGGPGRAERRLASPVDLHCNGRCYLSFCARVYGDAGLSLTLGNSRSGVTVGWDKMRRIFINGELGRDTNSTVKQPITVEEANSMPRFYVMRIVVADNGSGQAFVKVFDPIHDLVPMSDELLEGRGMGNRQWTLIASGHTNLLIDRLILRSDGCFGQIDGICIGTTWESVTGCHPSRK